MRSRLIWLLLAVCVVTFLGIGLWTKGEKKEVKEEALPKMEALPEIETLQEPKQAVKEGTLPQEQPSKKPRKAETVIMEPTQERVTIQGRVTGSELICTDMVLMVDGIHLDAGSVDLTGVQIGDFVEVTYIKTKYGKYLESVEVLEKR